MFVHVLNIFLSFRFGKTRAVSDECVWYAANITLDTLIGIPCVAIFMWLCSVLVRRCEPKLDFLKYTCRRMCASRVAAYPSITLFLPPRSGEYCSGRSTKPRLSFWAAQLCVYLCSLLIEKSIVFALLMIPALGSAARNVLRPVSKNEKVELLVVM